MFELRLLSPLGVDAFLIYQVRGKVTPVCP